MERRIREKQVSAANGYGSEAIGDRTAFGRQASMTMLGWLGATPVTAINYLGRRRDQENV